MTDYLEYAKRQGLDIHSITGVIIYPDGGGIPQDILLIPYEAGPDQHLHEIIKSALAQDNITAIFNYFQNVRWTMPGLKKELEGWTFEKGQEAVLKYFGTNLRLSYGTITFDRTWADMIDEEDETGEFKLLYSDQLFTFSVTEFPKNVGPAKLFKKINR